VKRRAHGLGLVGSIVLGIVAGSVAGRAQTPPVRPPNDDMRALQACSKLPPGPPRVTCLDKIARTLESAASTGEPAAVAVPPAPPKQRATPERWVVSETTSPIDYSPVATASSSAAGSAPGKDLQVAIQCRAGRSEVRLIAPGLAKPVDPLAATYTLDDGPAVPLALEAPASGNGLAIKGDIGRWLAALPQSGTIEIKVRRQASPELAVRLSLESISEIVRRMAGPCRWAVPGKVSE
jgi:hypothetical protein